MQNQRLHFLDYGKAISVIIIIVAHMGFDFVEKYGIFVMPLFFVASGYTVSPDKYSFGEYTKKRFQRILIPFWTATAVYIPIEMIRAYLMRYGDWKVALPMLVNMAYGTGVKLPVLGAFGQLLQTIMAFKPQPGNLLDVVMCTNCHLWFLPVMFTAGLVFFPFTKVKKHTGLVTVLGCAGMILLASVETIPGMIQLPYGLGRGFLCAAFMLVGYRLKESGILKKGTTKQLVWFSLLGFLLAAGSILAGSDCSAMIDSYYGPYGVLSVLLTFVGGAGSVLFILMLCQLLEKSPLRVVKKVLADIGNQSMDIYLWHFLIVFVLDAVAVAVFGAKLSPDIYYMELFTSGHVLYRIFKILVVFGVLTYGLPAIKKRIQKK